MKKLLALSLVFVMVFALAACATKKPSETPAPQTQTETVNETTQVPTLEPAKLSYYIVASEQPALKEVNKYFNELVEKRINATVDIKLLDWGAYDQKMKVTIAAAEEFDLCWTAPGFNDFYSNVAKGAFLPLDELLKKVAPKTYAGVPADIWDAAKVNGKIYGIINYQIMSTAYGFAVQRDIATKAGVDYSKIKKYSEIEPFMAAAKANNDKIALGYSNTMDPFVNAAPMHGFDPVGDLKSPGWIKYSDKTLTVQNQYESKEFTDLVTTMRKWFNAGYMRKDAATTKDFGADLKSGKYAVIFPSYLWSDTTKFDTSDISLKNQTGGIRHYSKMLTKTIVSTERAAATLTGLSVTSKNPERAMMLVELLNSDENVYNALVWGKPGVHFKKVDITRADGAHQQVEQIKGSGWEMGGAMSWEFGNVSNQWLDAADSPAKDWLEANAQALKSPTLGFTFDATKVTNEIAQCNQVVSEYLSGLTSGSIDPDKYLKEFRDKLKAAGAEKIIAEKQAQINVWKANK
jgi:putative aldouronate transport system substrate-binding protein